MLKPKSFRGRCPLDPRRGSAPGPRQGPLSGPLDPTPLDAPLASLTPLSWIVNYYPWLAAPILNSFRRACLPLKTLLFWDLLIHKFIKYHQSFGSFPKLSCQIDTYNVNWGCLGSICSETAKWCRKQQERKTIHMPMCFVQQILILKS